MWRRVTPVMAVSRVISTPDLQPNAFNYDVGRRAMYTSDIATNNGTNVGTVYCRPSTQNVLQAIPAKATIAANVGSGWAGSFNGSGATPSGPSLCRKRRCVSKITTHTKNMPATAVP